MTRAKVATTTPMEVLLLSILLCFLRMVAPAEAACYDPAGTSWADSIPCNASAPVSVCCNVGDYCLSNGLCLDTNNDNIFTVQGCTSRSWEAPCKQYCPDVPNGLNWYQGLTLCKTNAHESGVYCCGGNASCCDNGDALFTLPIFNSVFKPSLSTPPRKNNSSRSMSLGLGLGLGLGLAFLALGLAFVGWELRKRKIEKKSMKTEADSATEKSSSTGQISQYQAGNGMETGASETDGQVMPLPMLWSYQPPPPPSELRGNFGGYELPDNRTYSPSQTRGDRG